MSSTTAASRPASGSASGNGTSSSLVKVPATAAAGALVFTQPAQTANPSYYKIAPGVTVTFGWNFSDVLVTPQHLTVSAICDNGNTYPVGPTDGVIDGKATQVLWDIYSYQSAHSATPLAQASYTLTVWDDRGPNVPRQGGYLSPNSGLRFALYSPQAYTPLASGWTCQGICNSAEMTLASHPALVALITTFTIMILSGWSLLRHP